jgi:AcrR family transcriptional regulator
VPRPRTVSDEAILAATAAVVGDVGPDRLTLADVGHRVGLSPATLVQRFGSRRALLLALAAHDVDAVPARIRRVAAAPGDLVDALIATLTDLATAVDDPARFANHLAFLLKDLSDPQFRAIADRYATGVTTAIAEILAAAAERGEFDSGADPGALAELVHVTYNGALVTWGMTGRGTAAGAVERHLRTVLAGVRSAAGRMG